MNVNFATPWLIAVTIPESETMATDGFVLVQLPPLEGDNSVISPTHSELAPTSTAFGLGKTTIESEISDTQPLNPSK